MNIHDAAKLAREKGTGLRHPDFPDVCILPTETTLACVCVHAERKKRGARWQPTLQDLIREDWGLWEGSSDKLGQKLND